MLLPHIIMYTLLFLLPSLHAVARASSTLPRSTNDAPPTSALLSRRPSTSSAASSQASSRGANLQLTPAAGEKTSESSSGCGPQPEEDSDVFSPLPSTVHRPFPNPWEQTTTRPPTARPPTQDELLAAYSELLLRATTPVRGAMFFEKIAPLFDSLGFRSGLLEQDGTGKLIGGSETALRIENLREHARDVVLPQLEQMRLQHSKVAAPKQIGAVMGALGVDGLLRRVGPVGRGGIRIQEEGRRLCGWTVVIFCT